MKYLRRLLWFLGSRLLIITFCLSLLTLAFFMAMNMANIYILLGDGLKARAEVVLTRDTATSLDSYFRDEFLSADPTLHVALSENSPYQDYEITNWEYDLKVMWMWSWPWEDSARATVSEGVREIRGSLVPQSQSLADQGLVSKTPPAWQGGEYEVTLLRAGGRWRISGLRQTRVFLPEETPAPAQDPTPSPAPQLTL